MNLTPEQFLEQLLLGAEVTPQESEFEAHVRVGRYVCAVDFREFDATAWLRFERLYYAGAVRFTYPGDFTVTPRFLTRGKRTRSAHLDLVKEPITAQVIFDIDIDGLQRPPQAKSEREPAAALPAVETIQKYSELRVEPPSCISPTIAQREGEER